MLTSLSEVQQKNSMKNQEKRSAYQQQLSINSQAVMTHFCYGYCAALLKKLKALKVEGRIFEDAKYTQEVEEARQEDGRNCNVYITDIASTVVNALREQVVGFRVDSNASLHNKVDEGIAVVEEFLAIFEKKPEYDSGPENPAGD